MCRSTSVFLEKFLESLESGGKEGIYSDGRPRRRNWSEGGFTFYHSTPKTSRKR